jgi:cyclopropane-fatty-acyl-phospholipid synthase
MSALHRFAKKLFLQSLESIQGGSLELVCPDRTYLFGDSKNSDPNAIHAMAFVHNERFFLRAILGADVGMGESFTDGDWSSPDTVALVRLCTRNLRTLDSQHKLLTAIRRAASRARHALRANTQSGSRKNIRAHYDLGNNFYELFLDQRMQYSSAIFPHLDASLEAAQLHKMDVICRKLQLKPGDRVLEIGCGWGGFALHAATHYGAQVTATTISQAQLSYAQSALKTYAPNATPHREAASARAHQQTAPQTHGALALAPAPAEFIAPNYILEDYRNLRGQFDKIVSVEMFEAVGLDHYDEFFSAIHRLLAPGGQFLMQTISMPDRELADYRRRVDWIQTYIFPGSELAFLSEIKSSIARIGAASTANPRVSTRSAAKANPGTPLLLTQIESLGLHYAQTLNHWRERLFQNHQAIRHLGFDESFLRLWSFYLSWCQGAFTERYIDLLHLHFTKPN